MKDIDNNPLSWMLGLALNTLLVFYVHIMVEGGPDSLKGGTDWPTILNDVPQTLLIVLVAVLMPYMMLHYKRKAKRASITVASRVMLATTMCGGVLILVSQTMLTKELTLDIGWKVGVTEIM
jgi:ABC-type glycerol-3-phosphate transport system permease component